MNQKLAYVLFLILAAGCIGAGEPPLDGSGPAGPGPAGDTEEPPQGAPGVSTIPHLDQAFAGSDCTALQSNFRAPPQLFPDEVPPEWRNEGVRPRFYGFLGFSCERIGLPGFERGPAILLFETHVNAEPPEACSALKPVPSHIIRRIYASDEGLVTALRTLLGFDAILVNASFDREALAVGETVVHRWSSLHGDSHINLTRLDEIGQNFDWDFLWLGVGSEGPWRIDFKASVALYRYTSEGTGWVSEETLHASMYGQQWVGTSGTYGNVSFSGEVTRFSNPSCEEVM